MSTSFSGFPRIAAFHLPRVPQKIEKQNATLIDRQQSEKVEKWNKIELTQTNKKTIKIATASPTVKYPLPDFLKKIL